MGFTECICEVSHYASWVWEYIYIYVKSHTMNKVRTIYSKAQIKCVHSYEKGMYLM